MAILFGVSAKEKCSADVEKQSEIFNKKTIHSRQEQDSATEVVRGVCLAPTDGEYRRLLCTDCILIGPVQTSVQH